MGLFAARTDNSFIREEITMAIPQALIDKIKQGKAILFLGSGALVGADFSGKKIPLGDDLRDLLCDRFLNESYKKTALNHVAEMAISEYSLYEVQDFIKDYFEDIKPSDFHNQIPSFTWRALFTTNYDLLIEKCYQQSSDASQSLRPIISNEDRMDEIRSTNNTLPFFKLHGCVSRTHDNKLPLVLTTDQYNESIGNRRRLFTQLYELPHENTIVFVGHSLFDHNVRSVMLELEKECPDGQRHYLLKPGVDQIETNFWAQKKISTIDITFEGFIRKINDALNETEKRIALVRPPTTHPIQSTFNNHLTPSDELISFLSSSAEWIDKDKSAPVKPPEEFFKGVGQDWSPVINNVAINRSLEYRLFEGAIERPEIERVPKCDFYIIRGEAGSGKTVLLRQLAWRAARTSQGIVLWINESCSADVDAIKELYVRSSERIFVFWDNAACNNIEINRFLTKISKLDIKVTLISAERFNEWNVRCQDLDEIVTQSFDLKYLSEDEISNLILKLETHNSLGPNLVNKTHDERCKELKEIHGRQLLVALHEATMGETFENIVYDEYKNIIPETAKQIYLTVCTLNRLRTSVRAGLISRIHNISFTDFMDKLYKPLEKVVIVKGGSDRDAHYYARHPEIAEIVFRRALSNTESRYREYIDIISKLNISYSSDRTSFRSLIKAKTLENLFPSLEDVNAIYKNALSTIGEDPYLLQQMANYERIRPNGSLDTAIELLTKAKDGADYDQSILHSLSVAWRDKANSSDDPNVRRRCRNESRSYLDSIATKWGLNSYISASSVELSLNSLGDLMNDDCSSERVIKEGIRKVQSELSDCRSRYPKEVHTSSLEIRFSNLINDHKAALIAMERSFNENDRDPFLGIKLSNIYLGRNDIEKAKSFLIMALDRRRSNHQLNYHLGELLRKHTNSNIEDILYYYRRAYTPGDSNYNAQFWYARFSFLSDDSKLYENSLSIFNGLRRARMSYAERIKHRDTESLESEPNIYHGRIQKKRTDHGVLIIDGNARPLYFPAASIKDDLWEAFQEGDRVKFNIGYCYMGPYALEITY